MSRTGAAFAPRIWTQRSGSLAAMRVTSRTPCPARPSAAFGASTNRRAMRLETTCGTWETSATPRSCSSGVISTRVAPRSRMRSSMALGALVADGVVRGDDPGAPDEQVGARGERAAALAAGQRVRADVAGDVGAGVARARRGCPALTLATSVTIASGNAASSAATTDGRDVGRHRHDDELRGVVRRRRGGRRRSRWRSRRGSATRRRGSRRCRGRGGRAPTLVPSSPAPTTRTGPMRRDSVTQSPSWSSGAGVPASAPRRGRA